MTRNRTIAAIGSVTLIVILAILALALPSKENVDESIRFAENGNIYMSQELCDATDPDISKEMEQKLKDWYEDVLSGKNPSGKVVCTD